MLVIVSLEVDFMMSLVKIDHFLCRTFKFEGLRVDESLRLYLEAFRLPGEAPVIQRLIEAFSSYWSVS